MNERSGNLSGSLQALIHLGTIGGLTDERLLEQFASRRDGGAELAFEVLVRRHGGMVSARLSRRAGRFARRGRCLPGHIPHPRSQAHSIRNHGSLGSWLYGVAHRVSLKASCAAARRRQHEVRRAEMTSERVNDSEYDDLESILLEEVDRLPEKYRAPIVLCYLEGLTHEEAARQLGWPFGTVQGRLARHANSSACDFPAADCRCRRHCWRRCSNPKPATTAVSRSILESTIRLMAVRASAGPAFLLARSVIRSMGFALSFGARRP